MPFLRRPTPSMRNVGLVVLLATLAVSAKASAPFLVPTDAFEPVGFQPTRGYFSVQPFDRTDLVNGTLSLTFSDLVLPGNAGMDLRITRSYNHQAPDEKHWSFSFVRTAACPRQFPTARTVGLHLRVQ